MSFKKMDSRLDLSPSKQLLLCTTSYVRVHSRKAFQGEHTSFPHHKENICASWGHYKKKTEDKVQKLLSCSPGVSPLTLQEQNLCTSNPPLRKLPVHMKQKIVCSFDWTSLATVKAMLISRKNTCCNCRNGQQGSDSKTKKWVSSKRRPS